MHETIEKMKKNEMSDFKTCTEMKKDIDTNPIRNRWYFMWQDRRKILATAVMVLSLLIVFNLLYGMDLLSECDEWFQKIINDSLILLAGIMSLCLISIELIAVLREKLFLITNRIHLILIAILLICGLLFLTTSFYHLFIFFCFIGFIIEAYLCMYEAIIHLIKPIIKLCKDDYSPKQKCKIITRASVYAFSYIIGLVVSAIFLFKVILITINPLFAEVDEYGDVYYDYGPGGIQNIGVLVLYCILPIILILSTFSMKIFHNEIIKRSYRQFNKLTIE